MCILTVEKKDLTRGLRDAEQDFRCCQNWGNFFFFKKKKMYSYSSSFHLIWIKEEQFKEENM
jgi:hypothetical protein